MSSCNHKRRAIYNSEDVCSFKLLNLSVLVQLVPIQRSVLQ